MTKAITSLFVLIFITTSAQEIALTFDDAPTLDIGLYNGADRTDRIVTQLKANNVIAAFFVVTSNLNADSHKRIKQYTSSGNFIANHTHSHKWIHNIGTKRYIKDVTSADSILKLLPGFMPWFRYPFLDEGKTIAARDSLRSTLQTLNLTNGYVTVDTYDWYLNGLLMKAVKAGQTIDYLSLRQVYLDHLWTSIQFYDNIAKKALGRSPKHVLLLHENDLSALFLSDLINLLKEKNWKIISPTDAYTDPIASTIPDVLFNGQGRVGALAKEKGFASRDLVQESEDEAYLDALVKSRNIFK